MRAYLITSNPGSGKSILAAELSRCGLAAVDADDLAFWEDSAGVRAAQPPDADDNWLLAHRWVWSRSRIEQCIVTLRSRGRALFFCGIARNQPKRVDLFEQVFLLMIDEETQLARLGVSSRPGSPVQAEAVRHQIRHGRQVFRAQMLALGAVPLGGTASPKVIVGSLLAHLHHSN